MKAWPPRSSGGLIIQAQPPGEATSPRVLLSRPSSRVLSACRPFTMGVFRASVSIMSLEGEALHPSSAWHDTPTRRQLTTICLTLRLVHHLWSVEQSLDIAFPLLQAASPWILLAKCVLVSLPGYNNSHRNRHLRPALCRRDRRMYRNAGKRCPPPCDVP